MSRQAVQAISRSSSKALTGPVEVIPDINLRRIPVNQAVERLNSHYSAIRFPPGVKKVSIRYRPLSKNQGLKRFVEKLGPYLAWANPHTHFQVIKLGGRHMSPRHASKLALEASAEVEKKSEEEYIDIEASRGTGLGSTEGAAGTEAEQGKTEGGSGEGEGEGQGAEVAKRLEGKPGITVEIAGQPDRTISSNAEGTTLVFTRFLQMLNIPIPPELAEANAAREAKKKAGGETLSIPPPQTREGEVEDVVPERQQGTHLA